jgi:hypothetical protein
VPIRKKHLSQITEAQMAIGTFMCRTTYKLFSLLLLAFGLIIVICYTRSKSVSDKHIQREGMYEGGVNKSLETNIKTWWSP